MAPEIQKCSSGQASLDLAGGAHKIGKSIESESPEMSDVEQTSRNQGAPIVTESIAFGTNLFSVLSKGNSSECPVFSAMDRQMWVIDAITDRSAKRPYHKFNSSSRIAPRRASLR